jgi:phage terminase large subunit-like protein
MTHFELAVNYCEDVVQGKIPNSEWTVAACQRFLDDLKKQADPAWSYRFEKRKAERVCKFIESIPHIKGKAAGKRIHLEPWECWIVCNIFGFVNENTGKRRFRKAYIEIPRGNGKSLLLSAIGLYMLSADGEGGAEVYVAARNREQTKAVFETSQAMVRRSPELAKKLGIEVLAHSITQPETVSVFRSLAAESQSLDGLNIHCAIVDELASHRTREVWDVIETGCQKREQSLLIAITTAGQSTDRAGIAYETHVYVQKLLSKLVDNDSFFGCIYTTAQGMDWRTEDAWRSANPNLGISVDLEGIRQVAKKAMHVPSSKPAFLSKHLNVWVNADTVWIPADKLQSCIDPSLTESDFKGASCYVGLDLASKLDLCAAVRLYSRTIDFKQHFYAFGNYWLPTDTADASQYSSSFRSWEESGHMILTPGSVTDLDYIQASLIETAKTAKIKELAYDPFIATQLIQRLQAEGIETIEVPMTVRTMSPAMKFLEEVVSQGRFHFSDPVLAWCISNCVAHRDQKDNIFPNKDSKNSQRKIDALVALLFAASRVVVAPLEQPAYVYKGRMIWS